MAKTYEELKAKWKPLLEAAEVPEIKNPYVKNVVARLLDNTETDLIEQGQIAPGTRMLAEAAPTTSVGTGGFGGLATASGPVAGYDPILITLLRRAMPNLMAYDVCGVQPMSGPTGLIFAMRSRYANNGGSEAFYVEANTAFSGKQGGNTQIVGDANGNLGTTPTGNSQTFNFGGGMTTSQAEALGDAANNAFAEMSFSIEKISVTAKTRALKAEYTTELAQDFKAIHGLDAETELSNILQSEMLAEINREVIRTLYLTAVTGCSTGTTTAGVFDLDTDSNGRWSVEKWKGLLYQIERETNQIAKDTRRGKGNILIVSSDVASALVMAGVLDYAPALNSAVNGLSVDDTGNTFAGVLNGRIKVYIDPYATTNFAVVGYKGPNPVDSGFFYCPYVPLQMVRAVGQDSFQPKIGFKTRYGMVANPFSLGATASNGQLVQNANVYYRRFLVTNLL